MSKIIQRGYILATIHSGVVLNMLIKLIKVF